ncbi:hypothetical protein [[Mycoplasma] anseris]|uniref:Uncharacterized protein n=1 Tax=[Mycoplasma] anseris TaxID=92400 RepID=A0A2Z4ND98_9BACT|nr:hypothetical protein [[Mycoplasma] anseris]AWX69540.1 hypothetical protein DP065_02125 [[Mycoplasma] anseris]
MQKSLLDSVIRIDEKEQAEKDKLYKDVLEHPKIKELIAKYNLSDFQIKQGMTFLLRYYDAYQQNNNGPQWRLIINSLGQLDIDISNSVVYKKQKMLNNFWLTNICPLDNDVYEYLTIANKNKPRSVLLEAYKAFKKFPPNLQTKIKQLTNLDPIKTGLYLIDENFIYSRSVFKYLSMVFATLKNKTVAWLDINILNNFIYTNLKNNEVISNVKNLLINVDYLFLDRMGIGAKSENFINLLINILSDRQINNRITFVSSPIDILDPKYPIIFNSKDKYNTGLEKVEQLFKSLISNGTETFKIKK